MRDFVPTRDPLSIRNAAAQRVPLPEISLVLPSEFHSSDGSVGARALLETSIHPSAPTPVWRSQIATAIAARIGARRQIASPGEQKIVARAVSFGERNFHWR